MVGRSAQRGATYLALIIAVAVVSAVLAATAQIISHAQQREREKQLLWAGDQIRRALLDYAKVGTGVDAYPRDLRDLLEDRRQPGTRRYLRRLYFDPLTGSTDWGLIVNPQQRIIGVYSKSSQTPIRTDNFPAPYLAFRKARSYAEWRFAAGELPPAVAPSVAGAAPSISPQGALSPLPGTLPPSTRD